MARAKKGYVGGKQYSQSTLMHFSNSQAANEVRNASVLNAINWNPIKGC